MNRKGFTLVELLVTLAILGIITGISIPLIKNIQSKQRIKQFETYKTSLLSGAKLYNDSYNIDLFGKRRSGCATITYNELKKRNLLKDIKVKNINCGEIDSTTGINETKVVVVKYLGKYYYNSNLVCRSSSGDTSTIVYPTNGNTNSVSCDSDGEASINVQASPENVGDYVSKDATIKVDLTSSTGISVNHQYRPRIEYLLTTNSTLTDADYNGTWQLFNFNSSKTESEQLQMIQEGITIEYRIGKIDITGKSGEFHLFVRTKKLFNLADEEWTPGSGWTTRDEYNYKEIGVYKVDNTPPTCGAKSGGNSTWTKTCNNIAAKVGCSDTIGYCTSSTFTTNLSDSNGQTENKTITIRDKAGNTTSCPNTYNKYCDKTAPTCGGASGGSTTWSNAASRSVGEKCTDALSGCTSETFTTNVTDAVQTKTVSITIKDNAGNTMPCSRSRNIYLDRTKPTCGSKSGGNNSWTKSCTNISVSVGCSDKGGSGCSSGTFSTKLTNSTGATESKAISIRDRAGNTTSCTNTYNKYCDITAPTKGSRYQYNGGKNYNGGYGKMFGYDFSDPHSGLNKNTSTFKYCYLQDTGKCDWTSKKCGQSGAIAECDVSGAYDRDLTNAEYRSGVSWKCAKAVRGIYHVCDKVGNCLDFSDDYTF